MSSTKNINTRYTTYFNESELNKLRYIAWHDRTAIKNNISNALEVYIEKWERKNGTITDKLLNKILE